MNDRSEGLYNGSDGTSDQSERMKDRSNGIGDGSNRTSGKSEGIRHRSRKVQKKAWEYSIKVKN